MSQRRKLSRQNPSHRNPSRRNPSYHRPPAPIHVLPEMGAPTTVCGLYRGTSEKRLRRGAHALIHEGGADTEEDGRGVVAVFTDAPDRDPHTLPAITCPACLNRVP